MSTRQSAELRRSWPIVAVTMIGSCFGVTGVPLSSIGVLIAPLSRTFGWSNTQIAGWALFIAFGNMIFFPIAGRLSDRFGVRPVLLIAMPLCSVAFAAGAFLTPHLWTLYGTAFLVGSVGSGISSIIYSRAINGWFSAARGAALGLMSSGIGLGALAGPPIFQIIVDDYGLRVAFLAFAAAVLVPLPLVALFLHERQDAPSSAVVHGESELTLREALHTSLFWLLVAASFLWTLCFGATFHLMPYLTFGGLSRSSAAGYIGVLGITSLFGKGVTGFVIDRYRAPLVCAAVFLLEAAAFISLAVIHVRYAYLPITILGFAHGAEVNCFSYCTARYFGMKAYGAIYGLLSVVQALGSGLGPMVFSLIRDMSHSYAHSFYLVAVLATAAAALLGIVNQRPFLNPSPAEPLLPALPAASSQTGSALSS